MKRILTVTTALVGSLPLALNASPSVLTDIAPVHGLVSRVMDGVGTPDLLVDQNSSPHGFSLRVSQASALQNADVVFWVGEGLTPWLEEPLETVAANAVHVELMEAEGLTRLAYRDDHEDHEEGHDDHTGHNDPNEHDDHAHEDHDDQAKEDGHDHHAHHHHGDGDDPHMWLDPSNASIWMMQIAKTLGEIDPENAAKYTKNAEGGAAELAALNADVAASFAPVTSQPYVVLHDAYQYFENAYGLNYAGAVLDESGASQGPKHLEEVRAQVKADGVKCIFLEPQLSAAQVATVSENLDLQSATIDPLGADLELGSGFYPALIRSLANDMAACLSR